MSLIASILLTIQLDSPLIGGTFSNPANTFPKLFNHDFFRAYPYFLPGCIAAVTSVIGAIFGYVFLEEVSSPSQLHSHLLTYHRRLCPVNAVDFPFPNQ